MESEQSEHPSIRRGHSVLFWGHCPECCQDGYILCKGLCSRCYGWLSRRKGKGEVIAHRGPRITRRVYPPKTTNVYAECVACNRVRFIQCRGLCSSCKLNCPEEGLPSKEAKGQIPDMPDWTPEHRARLDALSQRALAHLPVVGSCSERKDYDT